jgi:hypothetical protein
MNNLDFLFTQPKSDVVGSFSAAPASFFDGASFLNIFIFLSLAIFFFILLVRVVVLWYFRINKIVSLLEDIRDSLEDKKIK